jgi:hypothetical protein
MRDIIKRILKETNDFDWMREPINPWLEYDGIIFNIEPTREDVNMYIEMSLNNKKIGNADAWETGRERDIVQIIDYQKDTGEAVLAINHDGYLTFGDKAEYYGGRNLIRYSQLIEQEPLTESDDFGWIDDIPASIELKPRTIYYAEPPLNGDEAVQLLQLITNPPKNTSHIIKRIKETETTLSYVTVDSDINDTISWNSVGGVPLAIEHGLALGGKREYYDTVDIGVLFR